MSSTYTSPLAVLRGQLHHCMDGSAVVGLLLLHVHHQMLLQHLRIGNRLSLTTQIITVGTWNMEHGTCKPASNPFLLASPAYHSTQYLLKWLSLQDPLVCFSQSLLSLQELVIRLPEFLNMAYGLSPLLTVSESTARSKCPTASAWRVDLCWSQAAREEWASESAKPLLKWEATLLA